MAVKSSTGKSGPGDQSSDNKAPGEREGGGGESEDESEEESEGEAKDGDGKKGEAKGKEKKDELDLSNLPQEAQDYIKKLRRESAKYRTKAANLETSYGQLTDRVRKVAGGQEDGGDEMSAEDRLAQHEQTSAQLAFDNAVLSAALHQGVGADGLKYFRFLVNEKASELGEGEELSDDDLAEIADEARKATGGSRKGAKTSVTGDEGGRTGEKKPPAGKESVNLDQFVKMTVSQKSELQKNNPDLYAALFKDALAKRRFV